MPDVGKQTKSIQKMECPNCHSVDTILRLPRDTGKKMSLLFCNNCEHKVIFP